MEPIPRDVTGNRSNWPTGWIIPPLTVSPALAGVASYVASERSIDRLALISPFTSLVDLAKIHYPMLPISLLLTERYDSVSALARTHVPLHIIHGTLDDIVPFDLGKKLFESYPGPHKTFTELTGIHHNDIAEPLIASPKAQAFREFLALKGSRSFYHAGLSGPSSSPGTPPGTPPTPYRP